eukprot:TRINITY_DN27207_c0_g1_i1.p1 TRINITY_DN27207_c0_g1~~TRINITY_DN27207_c0_g1_i1.p1  ORF type:complete len:110 (+),score=20.24 TRINITY_DN27207_c0_g1_i1:202-531(+)
MDALRSLKIKTSTCRRLHKELHSYEVEVAREMTKTDKMRDEGADPYDLKQQYGVLDESRKMIPECQKHLDAAVADLKLFVDGLSDEVRATEEFKAAEEVLILVRQPIAS